MCARFAQWAQNWKPNKWSVSMSKTRNMNVSLVICGYFLVEGGLLFAPASSYPAPSTFRPPSLFPKLPVFVSLRFDLFVSSCLLFAFFLVFFLFSWFSFSPLLISAYPTMLTKILIAQTRTHTHTDCMMVISLLWPFIERQQWHSHIEAETSINKVW